MELSRGQNDITYINVTAIVIINSAQNVLRSQALRTLFIVITVLHAHLDM